MRWRFAQRLRMSREDLRQEAKEADGDPAIKARLRQLRHARARRRMLAAVPTATVVVTNPTHYAVALAYERGGQGAPRVVAKGMDEVAARIRAVAAEHGVPLVANPPLARALHPVELDAEVPAEHFKAVAEMIAYVWRLRGRARWRAGRNVPVLFLYVGKVARACHMLPAVSSLKQRDGMGVVRLAATGYDAGEAPGAAACTTRTKHGKEQGAWTRALDADRAGVRQRLHHADGREGRGPADRDDAVGVARPGPGARHRRAARGAGSIEIYGPESSGKTTLALHAIAEAQKRGGTCAFIDAEHALDPIYARKLGVDVDNLLLSQPDGGEQALEICDTLVRSGAIDIVVIDSVAALVPRAELEGEMGDTHVGLHARLMSQALRKLTGSVSKSNTMLIFLNQIRLKIGVMFGNPETTTGGNALKFYASIRMEIRRIGQIKDREEVVGNQTRVKVVKNKLAPPFRQVEFDIMYGEGISKVGELVDLGREGGRGREVRRLVQLRQHRASARGARTPSSSCATTRRWRS